MANVSVYNMEGKEVGTIELNDAVFGVEVNEHLVHMAVVAQLANKRQGTQKAKTRSEVSGGGRKPWRQKGTGHARQGSIRAPQWVHGGVALGPKPRDYSYSLNKKERRLGMKSALSTKVVTVLVPMRAPVQVATESAMRAPLMWGRRPFSSRSRMAMRAPCAAKSWAVARPMPRSPW